MRLSEIYDIILEIDNDIIKRDIFDFRKLNSIKIEKVSDLLKKIKMSKNSKIKNIIPMIVNKNSPYTEDEQKFLWDLILGLSKRIYISNSKEARYDLIKKYYKLQEDMYSLSHSIRKSKYN